MEKIKLYIISKLQNLEYIGDLQLKNGFYYFTVISILGKKATFENSIFEVVSIEQTDKSTYIILKVESSYLDFTVKN